jgi:hypothetical protein
MRIPITCSISSPSNSRELTTELRFLFLAPLVHADEKEKVGRFSRGTMIAKIDEFHDEPLTES